MLHSPTAKLSVVVSRPGKSVLVSARRATGRRSRPLWDSLEVGAGYDDVRNVRIDGEECRYFLEGRNELSIACATSDAKPTENIASIVVSSTGRVTLSGSWTIDVGIVLDEGS